MKPLGQGLELASEDRVVVITPCIARNNTSVVPVRGEAGFPRPVRQGGYDDGLDPGQNLIQVPSTTARKRVWRRMLSVLGKGNGVEKRNPWLVQGLGFRV
jgi:hypothetical protein